MNATITLICNDIKRVRTRIIWIIATALFLTLIIVGWTSIQRSRVAQRQVVCAGNLSTLGFGLISYSERFGQFPSDILSPAGEPLLSWRVELLRVIDSELYNRFDLTHAWNSSANMALLHRMPSWYSCPADKEAESKGIASYYAVFNKRKTDTPNRYMPFQLDPTVDLNCILLVEAAELRIPWTCPGDFIGDPCNAKSLNAALASSACQRAHSPYVIRVDCQRVALGK